MGSIGATELIIVAVVLVVLFGASRLPATAKGIGQALRVFKKEVRDDDAPADNRAENPAENPADEVVAELTTGPDEDTSTATPKPADRTTSTPADATSEAASGAKRTDAE